MLHGAREWSQDMWDALMLRLHPLLATVRRETFSDLPSRAGQSTKDESQTASPLFDTQTVSINLTYNLSEPLYFEVESFLGRLYETADQYGLQLSKFMLSHIGEVAKANDMTVDGSGRELFDVMIEAFEKVEWGFDDEGNHQMTFVVGPELNRKLSNLQLTDEQERQIADLIERKRDIWNASRSRRPLP